MDYTYDILKKKTNAKLYKICVSFGHSRCKSFRKKRLIDIILKHQEESKRKKEVEEDEVEESNNEQEEVEQEDVEQEEVAQEDDEQEDDEQEEVEQEDDEQEEVEQEEVEQEDDEQEEVEQEEVEQEEVEQEDVEQDIKQKPKKKQRKHNKNLGKVQTKDHEDLYNYIEHELGITHKKCSMGASKKGNKFKIVHEGDRKCPIREFRLNEIFKNENNEIICKKNIPLQGACRKCDDLWRQARIDACAAKNNGTRKEIYENYKRDYGKITKECSSCKEEIECTNFSISRNMECGLHNTCRDCSKKYTISVGNRCAIYMPDGHYVMIKEKNGTHDDHIFPLAYGGSDEKINHQEINSKANLSKSSTIPFESLDEINPKMISKRFRYILYDAIDQNLTILEFKSRMATAIRADIEERFNMMDDELLKLYKKYIKKINRKKKVPRLVKKFREYCTKILGLK